SFIPQDAGLLTELVYGVTQRKYTLDYYLEPYLAKNKKVENWVRQLLRVSVYQLVFLDKIPAHAAVNEAVEIAKKKGHAGIANLVNAVLRNIQRDGIRSTDDIAGFDERLSVKYSAPLWMIRKFIKDIGKEETEKMFASLLHSSKASIRVNTAVNDVNKAREKLSEEGFETVPSRISPIGLVGESGNAAFSNLFKEGGITIQDETSMLVAPALKIEPAHRVLDACAAPGGKTTHIAAYLSAKDGGHVTALDLHEKKLILIQENTERLHVS